MVDSPPPDNRSYGRLLGDYFQTVSVIAEMERRLDDEQLENSSTYTELLDQKSMLNARLDEVAGGSSHSDIQRLLDEAFRDD